MMLNNLLIQPHSVMDENMSSNLTCTSDEPLASSGSRADAGTMCRQQPLASPHQTQTSVVKRKRNLPGNPDPTAEVIALSPKTLMATNRFLCEICNKGFQRDQNLQLHRRGHNLPWKLKQRTSKEIRKRVYVCPEPSCVHHDPSRALGDLTGIKKHFFRKHGEKKWKCDKCSKKYAVQSDWKAHSKTCGTREYKCDCGTLFSRRDSFITHRAFCDALAEESARAVTVNPLISTQSGNSAPHMNLQAQFSIHDFQGVQIKREQQQPQNERPEVPQWLASAPTLGGGPGPPHIDLSQTIFQRFEHEFSQNQQTSSTHENSNLNPTPSFPPYNPSSYPHMSATALLQKAAQMGSTMSHSSTGTLIRPQNSHMSANTGNPTAATACGFGLGLSSHEELESGLMHTLTAFGNKTSTIPSGLMGHLTGASTSPRASLLQEMSCLTSDSGFDGSSFEEAFGGMLDTKSERNPTQNPKTTERTTKLPCRNGEIGGGGNDGLTRDFLGLRAFPRRDFLNIAGLDQRIGSAVPYEQQNQNQKPWQG
ncbi:hypothetical protein IFM89_038224 [Coptis chinensis]|uniref:C2H2-type domain-containing protein n=1 Tax=Coptis chinensis TaxID=261450 RepID=A0A835M8J4_9MAGN|nr:hypothetical protein IFM89_038224 [Coptis chinensis]